MSFYRSLCILFKNYLQKSLRRPLSPIKLQAKYSVSRPLAQAEDNKVIIYVKEPLIPERPVRKRPENVVRPPKEELQLQFKCRNCGTVNECNISKYSFEKGLVLANCRRCMLNYMVADRLNWFPDISVRKNNVAVIFENGEISQRIYISECPKDEKPKNPLVINTSTDEN